MKSLGNRLDTVLQLVGAYGPFSLLSDVGSDHAFVAIGAVKNGFAKNAVASDIRKGPLETGRENALRAGVNVDFVLSDGLDALADRQFDCICICGMGGEMIADILSRAGAQAYCRLFLQAMSAQDDLRKYLWENGFTIEKEVYTSERGKPYAILSVVYTGKNTPFCYPELFLGKEQPMTRDYASYVGKMKSQASKRRIGLVSKSEPTEDEDALISEADRLLQAFDEFLAHGGAQ